MHILKDPTFFILREVDKRIKVLRERNYENEGGDRTMKKLAVLLMGTVVMSLFLSGCFLLPSQTTKLQVFVVDANAGGSVDNSHVTVKEGSLTLTSGETDSNGMINLQVPIGKTVDIYLEKTGYALSAVKGLKIRQNAENKIEIVQMKASLNPEPTTQTLPTVNASLTTSTGTTINPGDMVKSDFNYSVEVNSINDVNIIYAALGKIPGAGYMTGKRDYFSNVSTASGSISISGFKGETALNFVVYDHNNNRVDKIVYLDIEPTSSSTTAKTYAPENVMATAYTTNRELEFYVNPRPTDNSSIHGLFSHTHLAKYAPKAAPKDANLWVEIKWTKWADSSTATTTDEPLGYNVYRSFDGSSFKKLQFVQGADSTLYRDKSAELAPGKEVWYKVTSEYAESVESTSSTIVHTMPLGRWSVILLTPTDGATNVLRAPTFSWKPANTLTGDSTITYDYLPMLSDDVNGGNESFCPLDPTNPNYFYEILDTTGGVVSMNFTDAYGWYNIYASYIYPSSQLEPNKTYQWDLIYAVAYNHDQTAFSIAADWWPFLYPIGVDPAASNRFTTGEQ